MQVELAASLPYARQHGTAAPFVLGAKPYHRIIAGLCCGLACCSLRTKGYSSSSVRLADELQLGAWSKKG